MKKIDLIKALFKDPTIKALYDTGHFNATDINRAILSEAQSTMTDMQKETDEILAQIKANSKEATDNTKELEADATKALRATAVAANKMGNNSAKKSTLADLAAAQKALRARGAKLPVSKKVAKAAVKTEPSSDDEISAKQLGNLGQNAEKADLEVGQIVGQGVNVKNAAQVAQQLKQDLAPQNDDLDDDPQKVADAVKAAQQDGEKEEPAWRQWIEDNGLKDLFNKMYDLEQNNRETLDKAQSWDDVKDSLSFLNPPAEGQNIEEWKKQSLSTMKKAFNEANEDIITIIKDDDFTDEQKKQKVSDTIDNFISDSSKKEPTSTDSEKGGQETPNNIDEFVSYFDTAIDRKAAEEFMNAIFGEGSIELQDQAVKLIKAFVVHYFIENNILTEAEGQLPAWEPSFKRFKTEMELDEKQAENLFGILKSPIFHSEAAKLRDFIKKPDAEPQDQQDIGQKRKELQKRASVALSGTGVEDNELLNNKLFMIFLGTVLEKEGVIQEQEEQLESYVDKYLPQLEDEETRKEFYITQKEVEELKTFLSTNKENADKIIAAVVKKSEDDIPEADDEDVSPPELAEFQEAWTENLQTFFGKNPKKSSFMRRLLLRDQASMLYTTISVLEQIESGEQKGKEGEAASLTDMNKAAGKKKEDPKPDNTETSTDQGGENQGQGGNEGDNDSNSSESSLDEQTQQTEKVQLPPKKKRIIKQDLQAMVDLLRDVKKAIGNYKNYSTRNSVDPRFDGSKLKAKLDNLLAQAQEDIFDLHSNLELPSQQPSEEEGSIEEALNGIFMEKADPQRKEKIALVKDVYMEAKRLYVKSLAVSMERQDWEESKEEAGNILEILKREDFIALFPTGMSTASGKIMTVTNAYDVMKDLIQKFIEIVRDIVLIAKTDYVSPTSIRRSKMQLKSISEQIADLFKIPSKFSPEELRQAKQEEAEDENNQALTPIDAEKLDKQENDSGANVTQDGPTIGPGGQDPAEFTQIKKEIDRTESIPEPQKEDLKGDVDESASWFSSLDNKKQIAVGMFGNNLITIRGVNEVDIPRGFAKKIQTDEEVIKQAFERLKEDQKPIVQDVLNTNTEEMAVYLQTILRIKNQVGEEPAKKFLDYLKSGVGKGIDKTKEVLTDPIKKSIEEKYNIIKPLVASRSKKELEIIKGIFKTFLEESGNIIEKNKSLSEKERKMIQDFQDGSSEFIKKLKESFETFKVQKSDKFIQVATIYYQTLKSAGKEIVDQLAEKMGESFKKLVSSIVGLSTVFSKMPQNLRALALGFLLSTTDPEIETPEQGTQWVDKYRIATSAPTSGAEKLVDPDAKVKKKTSKRGRPFGSKTPFRENDDFDNLEEALKPIIATMLKENYNK